MRDIDPEMLLAMQEVDALAPNAPPITPVYGPEQDPYYILGLNRGNRLRQDAAMNAAQSQALMANWSQQQADWAGMQNVYGSQLYNNALAADAGMQNAQWSANALARFRTPAGWDK